MGRYGWVSRRYICCIRWLKRARSLIWGLLWGVMSENNSLAERPGDEPEAKEGGELQAFLDENFKCPKCGGLLRDFGFSNKTCRNCDKADYEAAVVNRPEGAL